MGLGSSKKITSQLAKPASRGIHVVSALPLTVSTRPKAMASAAATGSSNRASKHLIHFGIRINLAKAGGRRGIKFS